MTACFVGDCGIEDEQKSRHECRGKKQRSQQSLDSVSKQLESANKVQSSATAVAAADTDTVADADDADDADANIDANLTDVDPKVVPSDSEEQLNKPLIGLSLFVPFCLVVLC